MEDNKYYTPSIEEFHVGFEYEHSADVTVGGNKLPIDHPDSWFECKLEVDDDLSEIEVKLSIENVIRVKYLDKEDIEAEGFSYKKHQVSEDFWKGDTHDNTLIEVLPDKTLCIRRRKNGMLESEITGITIKNRSELKRILKMIGA
jgi:hypothetical protein